MTEDDAKTFERCMSVGGVAVFPADTVYGLACDPDVPEAVRRLYALKRRPAAQASAVMFFDRALALAALPEAGPRLRAALDALLPGGVTLLLPNPARRFPLACGADPGTLGLRVPALAGPLAPLTTVRWPVLQSSANIHGQPDARRIDEVPPAIRAACDLVLDAGDLPGTPSTVVDLRRYEDDGRWSVLREGAVPTAVVGATLAA